MPTRHKELREQKRIALTAAKTIYDAIEQKVLNVEDVLDKNYLHDLRQMHNAKLTINRTSIFEGDNEMTGYSIDYFVAARYTILYHYYYNERRLTLYDAKRKVLERINNFESFRIL
jgi:phosphate uptake regulator